MIVWEGPRPIDNVPFPPRRLYHSKNSQLVRGEAASCAGAHLVGPEATEAGEARKNKLLHPPAAHGRLQEAPCQRSGTRAEPRILKLSAL